MPPKKGKKGGGKGKKAKKGKKHEVEEEVEDTEYDQMDPDMLQEVVPMLKVQLEKQKLDRNYVQLERDTIQTFFGITRKEVKGMENRIAALDRQAQKMEENHHMEVRVYLQKVKHKEYEHKQYLQRIENQMNLTDEDEGEENDHKLANIDHDKKGLKMELHENEFVYSEEIKERMLLDQRTLDVMRKDFEKKASDMQERCDERVAQLEEDLELRRKVHVHEIEERKNLHINDLMRNHERAFSQMKNYYNDITADNLQLIRSLKDQVSEMKVKQSTNQKLMFDINNENHRLREPLLEAVKEVADLRAKLKDRAKDRLSLRNCKARKRVFQKRVDELRTEHNDMKGQMVDLQKERDSYYSTFEGAIKDMQRKSEIGNVILESNIHSKQADVEAAGVQIEQVTAAANLPKAELDQVQKSISDALNTRNSMAKELEYQLIRLRKGFNDSLAAQCAIMDKLGVPQQEINKMGFVAFSDEGGSSTAPAGLVAGRSL